MELKKRFDGFTTEEEKVGPAVSFGVGMPSRSEELADIFKTDAF